MVAKNGASDYRDGRTRGDIAASIFRRANAGRTTARERQSVHNAGQHADKDA